MSQATVMGITMGREPYASLKDKRETGKTNAERDFGGGSPMTDG